MFFMLIVIVFHACLSYVFLMLSDWMLNRNYFLTFELLKDYNFKKIFGRYFLASLIISPIIPINAFGILILTLYYSWIETENVRKKQTLIDIKNWFLKYWKGEYK